MLYYLQVLRGVAALMVVGFHYKKFLNEIPIGTNLGDLLFGCGYMGVDVFFLISGFIITYSTRDRENSHPIDFAIRRLFRIVPLAWFVTLLFAWVLDWPFQNPDMVRSFLFIPAKLTTPPFYGYSVVAALWTLSYEVAFYMMFCIALGVSHRYRTALATTIIVLAVVPFQYLATGSMIWDAHAAAVPRSDLGFLPGQVLGVFTNPLLFEFVLGMWFAEAIIRMEKRPAAFSPFAGNLVAFLLLSGSLYFFLANTPDSHGLTRKGVGALLLFTACMIKQAMAKEAVESRSGMLYFAGTISYSLYLVHNSLPQVLLEKIPVVRDYFKVSPGLPAFLACFTLSIAISALLYRYVESPFIKLAAMIVKWRRQREARPPPAGAGGGALNDNQ